MNRRYSIDVLRIISAIAVIGIHTVSAPVANSVAVVDVKVITTLELLHSLMNWSVPVFFMITGYCLLKKQECTYKYCFSHVVKYVSVLFTVGLFYSMLEEIFHAKSISNPIIIRSVLNVFSGNLWDHMWFVYAIIGIYLVMPVIYCFMQQGKKNIFILTGVLFFFNIFCPSIKEWFSIGIMFPFGGYLFYVCFGGAVAKCCSSKRFSLYCSLLGILSVIWIILKNDSNKFGYSHLTICVIAMSIFLLISRIEIKPRKWILEISKCTWGIYLIHPFFINMAIKVLKIDLLTSMPYMKLFIFAIMIFFISFVVTWIFRKIPLIKILF